MIKKLLMTEHEGSEAIESVILAPLIFVTFVILLYFMFLVLTFISYNNVANSIAQELNMRQTGYQAAMASYPYAPQILTYRNSTNGPIPPSAYLSPSKITVTPNTGALRSGTYFALDKYKNQFIIPFSEIKSIDVTTTKPINPSLGRKLAGTVIKVQIHYTTMSVGEAGHGLMPMTTIGYNLIS